VVGDDDDVGLVADVHLFERGQDGGEVVVAALEGGAGDGRADADAVLGVVGLAEPEEGEGGEALRPEALGDRAGRPGVLGAVGGLLRVGEGGEGAVLGAGGVEEVGGAGLAFVEDDVPAGVGGARPSRSRRSQRRATGLVPATTVVRLFRRRTSATVGIWT